MADAVELRHLVHGTRAFLAGLSANNTRDWFKAQKSRYDRNLKRPAPKLMGTSIFLCFPPFRADLAA